MLKWSGGSVSCQSPYFEDISDIMIYPLKISPKHRPEKMVHPINPYLTRPLMIYPPVSWEILAHIGCMVCSVIYPMPWESKQHGLMLSDQ